MIAVQMNMKSFEEYVLLEKLGGRAENCPEGIGESFRESLPSKTMKCITQELKAKKLQQVSKLSFPFSTSSCCESPRNLIQDCLQYYIC